MTLTNDQSPWWSDCVGYQVYLRSFSDSDGDGIGDLGGVVDRLDHLEELGVGCVWITPLMPSPQRDNGYDISDYRSVDPQLGSLDVLTDLVDRAHRCGIRVIFDLVVNHTSDEHPWFVESRSDRGSPKRDFYIWRDPAPGGGPPNNWVSHFGGGAWTWDDGTQQYYLHLFLPEQPDLNWDNEAMAAEVDDVIRFWLGLGVDGFRIDTAQLFGKAPGLPDNPVKDVRAPSVAMGVTAEWEAQEHDHEVGQPHSVDVFRRWHRITGPADGLLLGEVFLHGADKLLTYVDGDGLDVAFVFLPVIRGWEPDEVVGAIREAALKAGGRHVLAWVLSSHDSRRAVSRYGGGSLGLERTLALHTIQFFLPGMPFLYQGEELGLEDGVVPHDLAQDPVARVTGLYERSRDGARTPLPWSPGPGMGFTSAARTWLPFGGRADCDTASVQAADPTSPLARYRHMLALRRRLVVALREPLVWPSADMELVEYWRGDRVRVVANLTDQDRDVDLSGWSAAFVSTADGTLADDGRLPARTAAVLTLVRLPDVGITGR